MAMPEAQMSGVLQDFLRSQRPVIIYGAGRQATVVYDFCKMFRKKCACLVTTSSRERRGMLPPESVLPRYLFAEIPSGGDKADYDVVIALASKYQQEIQEILVQHGWKHNAQGPRSCRHKFLQYKAMQRAWTIAKKEDARLAYLVATARHCFKCKNVFSMKWRTLYNCLSYCFCGLLPRWISGITA